MTHVKCRSKFYPLTNNTVQRCQFVDNLVPWSKEWIEYKPMDFTAAFIHGKPWADLDVTDSNFRPKWNCIDGSVNRASFMGEYSVRDGRPLNPMGRTGLCGRGVLGRWGPNHAADPIVTRWKRSSSNVEINLDSGKKMLQFVAIQRKDSREWAIPGGMVDPGEVVTTTLKREFLEEACNSLGGETAELERSKKLINDVFEKGEIVYKGYVDDPRNTDNAWMETIAMNFHDDSGTSVGALALLAGDDAVNVRWMDVGRDLLLYASHSDFIAKVAARHDAHW